MSHLLHRASSAAFVLACATLTGCATYYDSGYDSGTPPTYSSGTGYSHQTQGYGTELGRVVRIERLHSPQRQMSSGLGALAGAVIGGVLGNQIGHGGGRAIATGLGVVGGAALGNALEEDGGGSGHSLIYRITIRTDRGTTRAFDVSSPGDLVPGDRVRVYRGEIARY
jgi:outer membrane lipoprotein SlyB